MRRYLYLTLQDNFINKKHYLLDISLKTFALLKQVPLFVKYLSVTPTVTGTYLVCGKMCLY